MRTPAWVTLREVLCGRRRISPSTGRTGDDLLAVPMEMERRWSRCLPWPIFLCSIGAGCRVFAAATVAYSIQAVMEIMLFWHGRWKLK